MSHAPISAPERGAGGAAPVDEFAAAWEGFFRAVRRAKGRAGARPPATGVSIAQYHLIAPLAEGAPLTVRALAEAAAVAAPTATRMLDVLVRDGLATREPSTEDRRCVTVALTPAGRAALAATGELLADLRARIAGSLTDAERPQAAALLLRLTLVVEEQLP
jgi:DNA-binding MarR family transcriptional regulator